MVPHARPHLEVHSRGKNHSAIAGVAYRLGLRLYDRRTGVWHDYRKRLVREEIIRALTMAPPGAPEWASDPHELWSRAEAAEKRKDAAIARDYRIPIPLGLSDTAAGDMAEAMARYIVDRLSVPVSIGVHRDNAVDAIGEAKSEDKIGAHAHLYFPTRSLEQMEGEGGVSEWVFGRKLVLLASKREGSAFVDQLNAHWAMLANQFTQEAGLVSDFDHRSYKRMGIDATPQPKLGAGIVAMERKGFFTRKGDALRGDIILPSRLYEATHAVVLAEQQRQAQVDVQREEAQPIRTEPAPEPCHPADQADTTLAPALPPSPATANLPIPLLEGEPGSLVARFRAKVPAPEEPEARRLFVQVLRLVRVIEKVLGVLMRLAVQLNDHQAERDRRDVAVFAHEEQHRERRAEHARAQRRLAQWEIAHRWRLRTATVMGEPAEWKRLHREVKRWDEQAQEAQKAARQVRSQIATFDQEAHPLRGDQREQLGRLGGALDSIREAKAAWVLGVRHVATEEEQAWIKAARPVLVREDLKTTKTTEPTVRQRALEHRPRLGRSG